MMVLATTSFPAPRACARQCEEANHVSSTGSKDRTPISCEWAEKEHTGRRAEPKAEGDAPVLAFSSREFRGSAAAEANLRAEGVPQSLPLSLSEHLIVVSVVSNTELECPSEIP